MTFFVRRCLQLFLFFEIILFVMVYAVGPTGLKSLYELGQSCQKTKIEIAQLQKEICLLEQQEIDNKTEFAKEKIAREQLLMKKNEEIVYLKNFKD